MASIFAHGLVAYTTTKVIDSKTSKLLLWLAIGSAMLPDADVIAFHFGIPYVHPLGHRGLTHSIVFAALPGPEYLPASSFECALPGFDLRSEIFSFDPP